MKTIPTLGVLLLLLTAGCTYRYKITFDNQHVTTTHGRPKVDEKRGVVTFKDAAGTNRVVPIFTVRSIEPL